MTLNWRRRSLHIGINDADAATAAISEVRSSPLGQLTRSCALGPSKVSALPANCAPKRTLRRKTRILTSSGPTGLRALDPLTGEMQWRVRVPEGGVTAAVPIAGVLLVGSTGHGLHLPSPLNGKGIDGIDPGLGPPLTFGRTGVRAEQRWDAVYGASESTAPVMPEHESEATIHKVARLSCATSCDLRWRKIASLPRQMGSSAPCSSAFSDGTIAADMAPLSLLCRLAPAVPPPRYHTIKYGGVLAPASKLRLRGPAQ